MRLRFALAVLACLTLGAFGGIVAAAATRSDDRPVSFEPPLERPAGFTLPDQDGKAASLAEARGKVVVLTFLYSSCPDLCPTQGAKILDAVVAAGVEGIQVYGISVDPESDTPKRARAFMEHQGLPSGPVRYLLGSREQLAPVWSAYGIVPIAATPAEKEAAAAAAERLRSGQPGKSAAEVLGRDSDSAPAAHDEHPTPHDHKYRGRRRHFSADFEHSAYVLLIDKEGRQRVGFPFEQLESEALAADIKTLLKEP